MRRGILRMREIFERVCQEFYMYLFFEAVKIGLAALMKVMDL